MDAAVDGSPVQTPLLDLTGKDFNIMWVDEKQPLFIPNNPQHFKAHKYQVLLSRLDKQAQNNPAQFNSTLYKVTLDEYIKLVEEIGEQALDAAKLAAGGHSEPTPTDSDEESISMDP